MEMSMDWLKDYPSQARRSSRIRQFSEDMMDARKEFCKYTLPGHFNIRR